MIERYDIKKIKGEEVLIIYLNYSYEFGHFGSTEKSNLKNMIKAFIRKHRLPFNGVKVCIIVGSILVGTLFLDNSKKGSNYLSNFSRNNIYRLNVTGGLFKERPHNNKIVVKNEDVIIESNNEEKIEIPKTVISDKKDVVNFKKEQPKDNNQNTTTEEITQEKENKSPMITLVRSNGTVLNLELEEYIIGVVSAEMPASFHPEALKAGALTARTYAFKKISNGKALSDTTKDQVYKDNDELRRLWGNDFNYYYTKVKTAVQGTIGEFITYQGNYIDAVYFSTSNGMSEDSLEVWGNNIPYLKSVSSVWDLKVNNFNSSITKNTSEISKILGIAIDENTDIEIINKTDSGRVKKIMIGDSIYGGVELRTLLGLKSTDFEISVNGDTVTIKTKGYGHGVGMSQYGANEMAKNGYNYRQIITHYYTGVTIEKKI